jgi:two-component system, chemotaxis family, CheB/CheR fusion protein
MTSEKRTGKRELRSRRDLHTPTVELQSPDAELAAANRDLTHLLANVQIPLAMISKELLVRRMTPQARAVLNLVPSDVGRRLGEIRPALQIDNLEQIAREAIRSGSVQKLEVQATDGKWLWLQVLPCDTLNGSIDGAVIALHDIDHLKRPLEEARAYAAVLIDTAREAIVILDETLRVQTANPAFYKSFHATAADTENHFIYEVGNRQLDIPELRKLLELILPTDSRVDDFEVNLDYPEVGKRLMRLNARRIEFGGGRFSILLVIEDVTELVRTANALRNLSGRLLQIRDEERRRIARDLHDSTGQKIAALKMALGRVRRAIGGEGRAEIAEAEELSDEISKDLRTVSYLLHPPMLEELGLSEALSNYIDGFAGRADLKIVLKVEKDFPRIAEENELALFRVVQEALTNVIRHSGAKHAEVTLRIESEQVVVEVMDDGRGLAYGPTAGAAQSKPLTLGVGITGMRERVRLLRGHLEVQSDSKGTTVRASVPVDPKRTT